jgi:hypothetical protein
LNYRKAGFLTLLKKWIKKFISNLIKLFGELWVNKFVFSSRANPAPGSKAPVKICRGGGLNSWWAQAFPPVEAQAELCGYILPEAH